MIHPQPQIKSGLLKFQLPPAASQGPSSAGLAASGENKAFFGFYFFPGGGQNVQNLKSNRCFTICAKAGGSGKHLARKRTSGSGCRRAGQGKGNARKTARKTKYPLSASPVGDGRAAKGKHAAGGAVAGVPSAGTAPSHPRPRAAPGAEPRTAAEPPHAGG